MKLLRKGKFLRALIHFQRAALIRTSPDNLFNVGLALLSMSRFSDAENYLEQVFESLPDNEVCGLSLGECYLRQKKWKKAEEVYSKLNEALPRNQSIKEYLELSREVIFREKYVKARDLMDEGLALLNSRKIDEALTILEEALTFEGNNPNILNGIGVIHLKKKKYREAYTFFEKALTHAPGNRYIRKNLMIARKKM